MARILVVDDALLQRKFLAKILTEAGHEPVVSANGVQALEIASTQKIDCIISDLLMPEMSGLELMEALAEKRSEIPLIVVTADIQESTRDRCLRNGAKAVIRKPVKADNLRTVLAEVLSSLEGLSSQ